MTLLLCCVLALNLTACGAGAPGGLEDNAPPQASALHFEAVSYTHLTVGASVRQYQNARAKLPENIRVVELESDDAWAVSYTHLDVYKRQAPTS